MIISDFDNSSFNKESYPSNDCSLLFNDNHNKDNLNVGSNSKFDINLTVLIKKHTREQ